MAKDFIPVKRSPIDDLDIEEGQLYDSATGLPEELPILPDEAAPTEAPNQDLFKRISDQYLQQQAAGNLPMGGVESQEPSLISRLRQAVVPSAAAAEPTRTPATESSAPAAPPASAVPEYFSDRALQEAQSQRDELLRGQALLDASKQAAQGMVTAGAQAPVELPEMTRLPETLAASKVADLQARKKGAGEQLSMEEALREATSAKEKADPNSRYSSMMRQFMGKLGVAVPEGTSGAELEKVAPMAVKAFEAQSHKELAALKRAEVKEMREANLAQRKKESEQREEERHYRRDERFQNQIAKIDDKNKEADSYVATARSLAKEAGSNPEAARQVAKAIVKAIEGAGARVSDRDYTNAISGGGLWGKGEVIAQQLEDGTLPPIVIENIDKMLNNVETVTRKRFGESKQLAAKQFAKRAGVPVSQAYETAQLPIPPDVEHDEALAWAKKNPDTPQAQKILKMHKGK